MKRFKIYAHEFDHNGHYSWRFAGVLKAESEYNAYEVARKKFKFLRNKSLRADEIIK